MSAREEVLGRVRAALAGDASRTEAPRPAVAAPPAPDHAASVALFAETVADYRAQVVRVPADGVASAVARALAGAGARSLVVPPGLDPGWLAALPRDLAVVHDDPALTARGLDRVDAVVTAAALGVATTGTVVLDHRPDQGRRALTLVPDVHVCVVRTDQVVHDVPDAVAALRPDPADPRPLTWVSGPSATSDIELERVEGVHGPRTLVVVLAGDAAGPAEGGDG